MKRFVWCGMLVFCFHLLVGVAAAQEKAQIRVKGTITTVVNGKETPAAPGRVTPIFMNQKGQGLTISETKDGETTVKGTVPLQEDGSFILLIDKEDLERNNLKHAIGIIYSPGSENEGAAVMNAEGKIRFWDLKEGAPENDIGKVIYNAK
jgi:hypothetical protein